MATRKKDLAELARSPGFTPGVRDLPALVDLLGGEDDELVRDVERAIVRAGPTAVPVLVARVRAGAPAMVAPLRARVVRAIGRLVEDGAALAFLLEALCDYDAHDAKARRNAAGALGKAMARLDEVETALLEAWKREDRVETHRTIAQSLGTIGGDASLDWLRALVTSDPELRKIADRAMLKLERSALRETPSAIDASVAPDAPCAIVFRCRAGVERILERELGASWSPRIAAPGVVEATLQTELSSIFRARTWLRASFPLPARGAKGDDAVVAAVIDVLGGDEAYRVMRTWTQGAIRYRVAWEGRGHSRALVWAVAKGVSEKRPALVNDPTQSTWEASIFESRGEVRIELSPRALVDPRFAYRTGDVPAASHPTLAAALARVAGARPEDVVWDPFVGSGSELVERAKLGPYARLVGSDVDARALEVARVNLAAAGVDAELAIGDAATHAPSGVTLIVTNPPMGRRVARGQLEPLMDRFVAHAAQVLVVGGRLVWLSPLPERTRAQLAAAGLKIGYRQMVDMGGFDAELQSAAKV